MNSKHQKYAKRSRKLSRKQIYGITAVTLIVVSLLAVYSFSSQPNNGFKAAIIDQLSSMEEYTNATFVKATNSTLTTAGYQVTYYKGSDVNVDFYRSLPQNGYKILIFRVHSALRLNKTTGQLDEPLDFFTSELYNPTDYAADQAANRLDIVMYNSSSDEYFGIPPNFVTGVMAMAGSFKNAIVILMGCNGLDGQLRSQSMLEALLDMGAKVIIGWNTTVSVQHTDIATERLLHHLLVDNDAVRTAVNETNNEMKDEPDTTKDELLYYPSKASPFYSAVDIGNYTIPHGPSNSAAEKIGGDYILSSGSISILALPLLLLVEVFGVFRRFRWKASSVFQSVSIQ